MKTLTKALSWMLVLAMSLSLMAIGVFAANVNADLYFELQTSEVTLNGSEKTTQVKIVAKQAVEIYSFQTTFPTDPFAIASLSHSNKIGDVTKESKDDGGIVWASSEKASFAKGDVIWTATYTIPVTTASGDYQIALTIKTSDLGVDIAKGALTTATIKVENSTGATAPKITTQPKSATYTRGAEAAALTVVAPAAPEGSTQSYQWQKSTTTNTEDAFENIEGAAEATYSNVSTEEAGTTYYRVIVTNTVTSSGATKSTTSSVATIKVDPKQVEITFAKGNEEATGTMTAQKVTESVETALKKNAFKLTGYKFAGWSGGGDTYTDGQKVTLTEGLELTAQWEKINYTITVTQKDGGTITVTGDETANYNDTVKFTVTPDTSLVTVTGVTVKSGSKSVTVEEDAEVVNGYEFTMPAGDVTISATYKETPVSEAVAEVAAEVEDGTGLGATDADDATGITNEELAGKAEAAAGAIASTEAADQTNTAEEERTGLQKAVSNVAEKTVENENKAAVQALVDSDELDLEDLEGKTVTVTREVYFAVQPTGVNSEENTTELTLNITPMYQVKAAVDDGDAIDVGAPKELKGATNVPMSIPTATLAAVIGEVTENTTITHNPGTKKAANVTATIVGENLTFTAPSFSPYAFSNTVVATVTDSDNETTNYGDAQAAINDAVKSEGNTVTITSEFDNTEKLNVPSGKSFTLDNQTGEDIKLSNASPSTVKADATGENAKAVKHASNNSIMPETTTTPAPGTGSGSTGGGTTPATKDVLDPYTDVNKNEWYAPALRYVIENGYMTGVGETEFGPSMTISRAMIAKLLANMAKADTTPAANEQWYDKAVAWAVKNNIFDGTNPEAPALREEFATMLYNYVKMTGKGYTGSWSYDLTNPDADDVQAVNREAMEWMVTNKVINGMDAAGTLAPQGTTTRAQFAQMLLNLSNVK